MCGVDLASDPESDIINILSGYSHVFSRLLWLLARDSAGSAAATTTGGVQIVLPEKAAKLANQQRHRKCGIYQSASDDGWSCHSHERGRQYVTSEQKEGQEIPLTYLRKNSRFCSQRGGEGVNKSKILTSFMEARKDSEQ